MARRLRVENQQMTRAVVVAFEGLRARDPDDLAAQAAPRGGLPLDEARWPELHALEPIAVRVDRGFGVAIVFATIGRRHEHDATRVNGGNRSRRGRPYH